MDYDHEPVVYGHFNVRNENFQGLNPDDINILIELAISNDVVETARIHNLPVDELPNRNNPWFPTADGSEIVTIGFRNTSYLKCRYFSKSDCRCQIQNKSMVDHYAWLRYLIIHFFEIKKYTLIGIFECNPLCDSIYQREVWGFHSFYLNLI